MKVSLLEKMKEEVQGQEIRGVFRNEFVCDSPFDDTLRCSFYIQIRDSFYRIPNFRDVETLHSASDLVNVSTQYEHLNNLKISNLKLHPRHLVPKFLIGTEYLEASYCEEGEEIVWSLLLSPAKNVQWENLSDHADLKLTPLE